MILFQFNQAYRASNIVDIDGDNVDVLMYVDRLCMALCLDHGR